MALLSSRSSSCLVLAAALVMIQLISSAQGDRLLESEVRDVPRCPCKQYYEVGLGETLQTISTKCRAPFILEDNPQIQDTDDVYPGLVLLMQCEGGIAV